MDGTFVQSAKHPSSSMCIKMKFQKIYLDSSNKHWYIIEFHTTDIKGGTTWRINVYSVKMNGWNPLYFVQLAGVVFVCLSYSLVNKNTEE